MTPMTHGGGAKGRIVFRGVRGRGIIKRPHDCSVAHVTRRAGHTFLLIGGIVTRIVNLDRFFHAIVGNTLNERGLLIF